MGEAEDAVALLAVPRIPHEGPSTHRRRVLVMVAMLLCASAMLGTYLWVNHIVHQHGKVVMAHRLSFADAQEIVSLEDTKAKTSSHAEHHKSEITEQENTDSNKMGTEAKVHSNKDSLNAYVTARLVVRDYESKSGQQISVQKGEWVFETKHQSNWTFVYTDKKQGWVPAWVLNIVADKKDIESSTVEKD